METYFLWAEAKSGKANIDKMIAQLVLTIGKERTFDKLNHTPKFLGCFDEEKIVFISYHEFNQIFHQNDFNWNITPSNTKSKEFILIQEKVNSLNSDAKLEFSLIHEENELKDFIKNNFKYDPSINKIKIDKNNFLIVYNRWREKVMPSISVHSWELIKKHNIIDGDFYLADLLSDNNISLKELHVVLEKKKYKIEKKSNNDFYNMLNVEFNDNQQAHNEFWNKYERPPSEEYHDYILDRRDLLVPQDVRERKGSFFTPKIWVEKSQEAIAKLLGDNWQDEYYIWDCAAGTGNLLANLVNKYNIWASTLDNSDIDIIRDRINNGANLLENHLFQFDFLNDSKELKNNSKLPDSLLEIINSTEKRKKLIVYINPPYAEAGSSLRSKGKENVQNTKIHETYNTLLGKAKYELFAQFLIRIYTELNGCLIANFSKIKTLQAPNFSDFREEFKAKLCSLFLTPANTFDNVKGDFPIGFFIWDTNIKEKFKQIKADVYNNKGEFQESKTIINYKEYGYLYINDWLNKYKIDKEEMPIGYLFSVGNDFQHQNTLFIDNKLENRIKGGKHTKISSNNLLTVCVYFTVRKVIKANWLNDRDQYIYPNNSWQFDEEFKSDCLTYTLFTNHITHKLGINHWIPFSEIEIDAKNRFESNFMINFIGGNFTIENSLFKNNNKAIKFSEEAREVFDAGRNLWSYYHKQKGIITDAGLQDIKEFFQIKNNNGRLNPKSSDIKYNELKKDLIDKLNNLKKKIQPKVFEHRFLLKDINN